MPIDPTAIGSEGEPTEHSWTSKDAIIYALGVGAGTDFWAVSVSGLRNT